MTVTYGDEKTRAGAADEPQLRPLEMLTDEELSVLSPDQGVVVAPVLRRARRRRARPACATAMRGSSPAASSTPGDEPSPGPGPRPQRAAT